MATPEEAGFDGAKGIRMNMPHLPDGGIFRLRRGSKRPSECKGTDFIRQLIWWTPEGESSKLLWCNKEDKWFELTFNPIEKP